MIRQRTAKIDECPLFIHSLPNHIYTVRTNKKKFIEADVVRLMIDKAREFSNSKEKVESIKKEILMSGFPLELYALTKLEKKGIRGSPNVRYMLKDKEKEIDLIGLFEEFLPDEDNPKVHLENQFIIECKKSEKKPWVFFSTKEYSVRDSSIFLDSYTNYYQRTSRVSSISKYLAGSEHYVEGETPVCVSFTEVFKKEGSSDIYKAIDSVTSYLDNQKKELMDEASYSDMISLVMAYPIVVLDGDLYLSELEKGDISVMEASHLHLRYNHDRRYVIEIVTKDYFPTLIDELIEDSRKMVTHLLNQNKS